MHALRDVDLAVDAGELVAVMGPSGSGKSTLLTIAGQPRGADDGEVLVGGVAVSSMSRNDQARLRRRSIGYVFQDFNLLAGLTAAENVSLPLELDGVRAREGARRGAWRRSTSSAWPTRADRFPDELSGGERQRVAIARAVVGERHLLLADEPSGALDSVNGEAVMRLIRAACQRGVAGVVVTHDAQLASWADRVVFLRDGRIVDQTSPLPRPSRCSRPARRDRRPRHAAGRRDRRGVAPARPRRLALGVAHVPPRLAQPGVDPRPARRSRSRRRRSGSRSSRTWPSCTPILRSAPRTRSFRFRARTHISPPTSPRCSTLIP